MTSQIFEMPDLSPVTSVTTIYAEGCGQKNFGSSSCSVRFLASSHKGSDVRSNVLATASSKPKTIRTGGRGPPVAKTTKTYEMRRKAGEAKAKEWAVIAREWSERAKEAKANVKTPIRSSAGNEKKSTTKVNASKAARKSQVPELSLRSPGSGAMKRLRDILYPPEKISPRMRSVEVQTCRSEIVNNMLLIGDTKILHPSANIWAEILRKREEDLKQSMLKEVRKVPEYSRDEVNYQTNLKEFLETGTVKRYERNSAEAKLVEARRDEIRRPFKKPKSPPEMDLKKRMSQIEEELMGVFKGRP